MDGLEFNQQRILEVASALSLDRDTVLDRSLGVKEGCLSARQMVHALQGGVLTGEVDHLRQCVECRQTLAELAALPRESGRAFVRKALKNTTEQNIFERVMSLFGGIDMGEVFRKPRPMPALVALGSTVFSVDPLTENLALTCDIIPVFESNRLAHLKLGSVRVSGAIVARQIPAAKVIVMGEGGHRDFLRVTVTKGELAPRVRKALRQGQHVVDTIEVTGNFEGGAPGGFLGQARLEFRIPAHGVLDTFSR